jgi:hypothetical protein
MFTSDLSCACDNTDGVMIIIHMYMSICICIFTGLLDAKSLSSSVIKSLETGVDIGDTQTTLRQYENDRYIKNLGDSFESIYMYLYDHYSVVLLRDHSIL